MSRSTRKTLYFSYIRLQNWKNFVTIESKLQRRVFLAGPNASGKSNLLDAFRFLRDIVSVGGGLHHAVQRRRGISSLRSLAARRHSDVVFQVHIGNSENPYLWDYEIHFNQDNNQRPVVKKEIVKRNNQEILSRPDSDDRKDKERLTQTHLEQVYVNQEFRDIVDFFAGIRYYHVVPQLVRDPDRSIGRQNDPYGGDFLEQIAKVKEKTQKARLRRIRDALKVAIPQLKDLELWRDERGTPHLRGNYEHWRYRGAWQTEEQFSDGTLRLMGLLWTILDGNGPLLLEEPELSLHPEVVRHIPQIFARMQRISGRQILVSTQSADLLRDDGIGLDELFLLQPKKEGTQMTTAGSSNEIYRLLQSGVSLAETVIPRTRPENVEQLSLFGD